MGETPESRHFHGFCDSSKMETIAEGIQHLVFEIRNDLLLDDVNFVKIRDIIAQGF